jgi:hypothetical protein
MRPEWIRARERACEAWCLLSRALPQVRGARGSFG